MIRPPVHSLQGISEYCTDMSRDTYRERDAFSDDDSVLLFESLTMVLPYI